MTEILQLRAYGNRALPTLVYLPGLHGDWTLVGGFRAALKERVHFVEMTYPRSLEWNIQDYADAIANALVERGITSAWLLGESFGSQLVWPLLKHSAGFQAQGVILAGGFVKHPFPWGPGALRWIGEMTPMWLYRLELKFYKLYSQLRRNRRTPEAPDMLGGFIARRTAYDREAMRHRLTLLDDYDPRPIAQQTRVPIYYLAGFVDPLVPWVLVRLWLRKNCESYRGGKTFWLADHNVLATASQSAADLVVKWMGEKTVE